MEINLAFMEKDNIYKRSLELANKFISEITQDELTELISKYEKMDIQGPTFDEYLDILQNELARIDWHSCYEESLSINQSDLKKYFIEYYDDYYPPPRSKRTPITNKKDSAIFAESFFLL